MMKIFLIGTSHTLQKGLVDAQDGCYDEFKEIVRQSAKINSVKTIGEEMSEAALGNTVSLCNEVANELNILHIFCDPNKAERKALGLPENDCSTTWSPREYEWLNRLNGAQFPVLFVCGAYHVDSFSRKCDNQKIAVKVLEQCWEPIQKIPLDYRII